MTSCVRETAPSYAGAAFARPIWTPRIKRSAEASDFLDGDLVGELAKRGIDAEQILRREGRSAPYEQGGGPNRTGAADGTGDP